MKRRPVSCAVHVFDDDGLSKRDEWISTQKPQRNTTITAAVINYYVIKERYLLHITHFLHGKN